MKDFSYITSSDPDYIENLYNSFVTDPNSIDPEFKKFFEGFDFAVSHIREENNGHTDFESKDKTAPSYTTTDGVNWKKELGAYRLILGYRNKGHLIANTNPIRKRKDRALNLLKWRSTAGMTLKTAQVNIRLYTGHVFCFGF